MLQLPMEQQMGLFDQVVGALAGGQSGGNAALLETVMQVINNPQTGGLAGLVQSFQQGGLGEIVNSWVSTGANLPISAEQIQSVLGGASLQDMAAKLGIGQQQASGSLAELLPQVIDQLTPNGQLPQGGDLMAQGLELLKGKLFS
nr:YidB family protein [Dechloromonas sp. TW-R-39-2]